MRVRDRLCSWVLYVGLEHSVLFVSGTGNSKKVAKAAAAKNVLSFANKLLDD